MTVTKIAGLGLPGDIGDVKMPVRATAQPNWLLCIGETIGNATSGADYAGAEYEPLFDLLNVADRWGNDGTAVFADGDTVKLPNMAGIGVTGAGTQNVNTRAKGGNSLGETVEDKAQGHKHSDNLALNNTALTGTAAGQSGGTHQHSLYYGTDLAGTAIGATSNIDIDGTIVTSAAEGSHAHSPSSVSGNLTSGALSGEVATPTSDGSNGTPRTGEETAISSCVFNFIIRYQ